MPRSHVRYLRASWAPVVLRTSAKIMPTVCAAAETTLPYGALATMTPWREQASMSMLSTPTPARPRNRRRRAWARNSAFTVVDERVMMASLPAIFWKSSSRGILEEICSTSKPRSVRWATPSWAMASMINTFMDPMLARRVERPRTRATSQRSATAEKAQELIALGEAAPHHPPIPQHLRAERDHLARAEVEAPIRLVHRAVDLRPRQVRVADGAHLQAALIDEPLRLEPPLALCLLVERGARIGSGQRDLDGVGIDLAGEADGLLDGLARLPGQAEDEGPVDGDAESLAVAGEAPGHVEPDPLLDVVEDLLVARLVAHEEEAQPVVFEDLEGRVRHVRLGVDRPGQAEPAQGARDCLRTRQVVGEGVIVEKELLHLGKEALGQRHLLGDVRHAARAIPLPAHRLRPQAEGALRPATASRVERDVRMAKVADGVVLHREIAVVHGRDEREEIHVLEDGSVGGTPHPTVGAIRETGHALERPPRRDFLDREVELGGRGEVEHGGRFEGRLGRHGHRRPHHADPQLGIRRAEGLGHLHVAREGGRARVHDAEVVLAREGPDVVEGEAVGGRIDEARARHQRRGLGQPRRVPERSDFAPRLIA